VLLGGSLAAFGGVYAWAVLPVFAGSLLLVSLVPPAIGQGTRALDAALGAVLAAAAFQLVPLPAALVQTLSPARAQTHLTLQLGALPSWLTLSIDPSASVPALLVLISATLVYGSARRVLEVGGLRLVCRGIGWMGLVLACVAMAQRGLSSDRIYGFWVPFDKGALPYGPFANRNHCATWLLMSIPLCVGYLVARTTSDRGSRTIGALRHTVDGRSVWLATAGTAMVLSLAWSFSRSGIAAFALASVLTIGRARTRLDPLRAIWIAGIVILGAAVVATLADVGVVLDRFAGTIEAGRLGRIAIWRDTLPLIRDFLLTGCGAGAYQAAMLVYQTGDRTYYYNQAHNEFLQVAAEGGMLVGVPAAIALGAFVALARRRMRDDVTGVFWIRAGAAAGLTGVALQSVWETGLRAPANALLAAVLAAVLTHARPRRDRVATTGG
jgi:putative inorganic carbon (HCO3(-)) transporter